MDKREIICEGCGQYESECNCNSLNSVLDEELEKAVLTILDSNYDNENKAESFKKRNADMAKKLLSIIAREKEPSNRRIEELEARIKQYDMVVADLKENLTALDRKLNDREADLLQARNEGREEVVQWIKRNAICSHEPSRENIKIMRAEWDMLLTGKIPPEREQIKFKDKPDHEIYYTTDETVEGSDG